MLPSLARQALVNPATRHLTTRRTSDGTIKTTVASARAISRMIPFDREADVDVTTISGIRKAIWEEGSTCRFCTGAKDM